MIVHKGGTSMKLLKKLYDWCFEEKKIEKIEDKTFYIPCNKFYNVTELKEERKISATVKN